MKENIRFPNPEKKGVLPFYDTVIVAPGFSSNTHPYGLEWDTRARLFAAALLFRTDSTREIGVGGAKIRDMDESFANLMQGALVKKYHIPVEEIITEEYTIDTATQVEWIKNNRERLGERIAIISDSQQKRHFETLLENYGLQDVDVLPFEDVIKQLAEHNEHITRYVEGLHRSCRWKLWWFREGLLTIATKTFDPDGKKLVGFFTKNRLQE